MKPRTRMKLALRAATRERSACVACNEEVRWGRAEACWYCLLRAHLVVTADGHDVAEVPAELRKQLYAAHYRYRGVRCGKADCRSCPHEYYVYKCWRVGTRAVERYLGPVDSPGAAYEIPRLRPVRGGFARQRA